jgi:hypothetical protein
VRHVGSLAPSGGAEGIIKSASEAAAADAAPEVDGAQVDVELAELGFRLPVWADLLGSGRVVLIDVSAEPGTEIGLPIDFGGVVGHPFLASGDGGLHIGDPPNLLFHVSEPTFASLQVSGLGVVLVLKLTEAASPRSNAQRQPVDGFLIGPSEEAPPRKVFEPGLGGGQILTGFGNGLLRPADLLLLPRRDSFEDREFVPELLEAAELGEPVRSGAELDECPGLFPEPAQDGGIFAVGEFSPELLRGGGLRRRAPHHGGEDLLRAGDDLHGPLWRRR